MVERLTNSLTDRLADGQTDTQHWMTEWVTDRRATGNPSADKRARSETTKWPNADRRVAITNVIFAADNVIGAPTFQAGVWVRLIVYDVCLSVVWCLSFIVFCIFADWIWFSVYCVLCIVYCLTLVVYWSVFGFMIIPDYVCLVWLVEYCMLISVYWVVIYVCYCAM